MTEIYRAKKYHTLNIIKKILPATVADPGFPIGGGGGTNL